MPSPSAKPATLFLYNHTGGISGAEFVLLAILRGLDPARYTPVVVAPEGDLISAAAQINARTLTVPVVKARFTKNPFVLLTYLTGSIAVISKLRSLVREHRPGLVHANSIRAGMVASLACRGLDTPVVWHLHDILPDNMAGKMIRKFAAAQKRIRLLGVSHATAVGFLNVKHKRFVSIPVEVIYNSLDLERFRPDSDERERVRNEFGLLPSDVAVGVVAQLTPRKRQGHFVQAFAAAQSSLPNVKLVLVGTALFNKANQRYAELLKTTVAQLGLGNKVILAGKRTDVPAILNGLDIVIQNSDREPLGGTLLEAMATQKPVVATRVDGTPEVVDDGEDGFLTPVHEPQRMMACIARLASDSSLRDSLGKAGREKVAERFSVALHMRLMHEFYDGILAQWPQGR